MTTLPATPHELAALVDDEQRRQDAHAATLRALASDSKALRIVVEPAPRPGFLAGLRARLGARRAEKPSSASTEDRLRGRIEAALKETKKGALLVDRFAAVREALDADVARVSALVAAATAAADERGRAAVVATVAAGESDDGGRAQQAAEARHDLAARTAERLSVVVASARGLITVIDSLSGDVSAFARAAERELDALSARARVVSVAEDAAAVVRDLEQSLLALSTSLDDVTAFASAVHARVAASDGDRFGDSLDALVQAALARKAAAAARERAHSEDP